MKPQNKIPGQNLEWIGWSIMDHLIVEKKPLIFNVDYQALSLILSIKYPDE